MARPSYGPEAKKRARRLLEALLAYANDELDCPNEVALNALRSQIQTRWQTENWLVVRTKVRFLEALTGLEQGQDQLNAEQIKEALKRFADFLEILEDNRPTRGGSETWHFTLKLWHKRQDREANLRRFDLQWERRRPEKSKQIAGDSKLRPNVSFAGRGAGDTGEASEAGGVLPLSATWCEEKTTEAIGSDFWQLVCRASLEAQNQRRLTTNPLTYVDGVAFELDEVYVPLGLVERKQRDRRSGDVFPERGSRFYESEETEITKTFGPNEFLEEVLRHKQSQRIAIVGEPGAGKTTLLQKIAAWVLDNTEHLPIWISLADLQGKTLEQYLLQDWLKAAIRKVHVPPAMEEALCSQFNQGRVWLLLDAVDEMAIASSNALAKIASFLKGWVADARVVLTCRLNVWDAGKNALENFDTYRNLNFSYGDAQTPDQVGQFIRRWFKDNPTLAVNLRAELDQPGRQRIKDAVKNPLRLALLCRTWTLAKGGLPKTKAMLYQQFAEAIYEWKQDRVPTTSSERVQLNRALGELALLALAQEKTRFRHRHRFVCEVLGAPDDGNFQLALQLGWLNQVGVSEPEGEKVYAFYHPSFQEYFAAQAVEDWHFFLNHKLGTGDWRLGTGNSAFIFPNHQSPITNPQYRIFEPQWREVILLWLGREDVPHPQKEEFIKALIEFEDGCGSFYQYQAYFLAAVGIAEFADCPKADEIVQQLVKWHFGYFNPKTQTWWRFPPPIAEGARVALLKTERTKAIAALEHFIKSNQNEFARWNAAYSLGKVFAPGNPTAIAALEQLVNSIQHEYLRRQAADSLGKVDPGNQVAIAALIQIIETTENESICRKAAYSLGKIDPCNPIAISTLVKMVESALDASIRQHAANSLEKLAPNHPVAIALLAQTIKKTKNQPFPRRAATKLRQAPVDNSKEIAALVRRIESTEDDSTRRGAAYKLGKIARGNPLAIATLVKLIKSAQSESLRKLAADNLKEILLSEQFVEAIALLKDCFCDEIGELELEQFRECYKLLWHCALNMTYADFYQAWRATRVP